VAGISTCNQSGIILTITATYDFLLTPLFKRMKPNVIFQIGRIVGFLFLEASLTCRGWTYHACQNTRDNAYNLL
jgi:hypothetical protein